MTGSHRIRRLRWHVRAGTRDEAFRLRVQAREALEPGVLRLLERAFDRVVAPGRVVRLPRLSLSLQVATLEALDALPVEQVASQLADQLATLHPVDAAAVASRAAVQPPDDAGWDEALQSYLRTGQLPWHLAGLAAAADRAALLDRLTAAALHHASALLAAAPPLATARDEAVAWRSRLFALVPDASWAGVIRQVAPVSSDASQRSLVEAAVQLATDARGARHERVAVVAGLLALLQHSAAPADADGSAIARRMVGAVGRQAIENQLSRPEQRELVARLLNEADVRFPASQAASDAGVIGHSDQGNAVPTSPLSDGQPGPAPDEETFALSVSHAGLVLLAPFLPQLFRTLELLEPDGRRLRPGAHVAAAAALLYAATGSDDGQEFDLGLVKLLVGMQPESPLPSVGGGLGTEGRREVDELLASVIEHWQALGRTSPDGLRASFLQRGGALRQDDIAWRLHVEGATHDVLLDRLPWERGTVMLPWVRRPIVTEWTTR